MNPWEDDWFYVLGAKTQSYASPYFEKHDILSLVEFGVLPDACLCLPAPFSENCSLRNQ